MAKLTSKARNAIPTSEFALRGRRYPIEDKSHARNALSRVSEYGSSAQKAKVRSAVHRKYPNMGHSGAPMGHSGKMESMRGKAKTSAERRFSSKHGS